MKKNKITQINCHAEFSSASHGILKQVQDDRNNESGRSMVEMLGVLAIIGVLSVAGIAGYTTAMNSHRANQTIDRIMKRAMIVSPQLLLGQTADISGFSTTDGAYTISDTVNTETAGKFKLTVNAVPQKVCEKIKSYDWTLPVIIPGTCGETNDMTFTFNNDLSPDESDKDTCEDGRKKCAGSICCASNEVCSNTGSAYQEHADKLCFPVSTCVLNSDCPSSSCSSGKCFCKITGNSAGDITRTECSDIGTSGIYTYGEKEFTRSGSSMSFWSGLNWCAYFKKQIISLEDIMEGGSQRAGYASLTMINGVNTIPNGEYHTSDTVKTFYKDSATAAHIGLYSPDGLRRVLCK